MIRHVRIDWNGIKGTGSLRVPTFDAPELLRDLIQKYPGARFWIYPD